MIEIAREIEAVQREVGTGRIAGGDARTVLLRRTFDAEIADVWNALTTPERISRWFLPISGDLRLGGHFQFEGNAGGEILECDRPNRLKVTWGMGEMAGGAPPSEVEVRLAQVGEGATRFELEHTAIVPDEMWDQFGPGAVGVGWEGGFLGLALHLRGEALDDPTTWMMSDEARDFYKRSSAGWGDASRAAGVDDETVERNVANTTQFYAPDPGAVPSGS
jgi:uncharacterized protein YndB with AHSA1/START domain